MFERLPTLPPTPPWEGMHPLVVHFPIALLLFAAVFVVLAMIVPKRGWWFSVSALILLLGGTAGAFVAVSTGEAAMNVAEGDGENEDEMYDVMQQHADAMEYVQKWFVWLTVVYAVIVLFLLVKPLRSWKFVLPVNLAFLVALAYANLLMANGAHLGGRLVHQYGVKSALAPEGGVPATGAKEETPASEDEKDATATEGEKESSAPDAEKETPAAEGMQEEPAPEAEKEAPAAEPKTEAPAAEAKTEVPGAEAKTDAPAPEPAKDGAAKDAPQL